MNSIYAPSDIAASSFNDYFTISYKASVIKLDADDWLSERVCVLRNPRTSRS